MLGREDEVLLPEAVLAGFHAGSSDPLKLHSGGSEREKPVLALTWGSRGVCFGSAHEGFCFPAAGMPGLVALL